MWLFTKSGFYSVVRKPEDGPRLTIRSRARADLVALRRDYLPNLSRIVERPQADYQFRAFASRRDFARAAAKIASEIDYPNFKDEVRLELGQARAATYHRVWVALLELERFEGRVFIADLRQAALQADR